jgi:hypothetical protein
MSNKIKCNFCGEIYTKSNKARHNKSKICQSYQKSVQAFNDLLLENKNKIKTFDDMIKKPCVDMNGKLLYLNNTQIKFLNILK